MANKRMISKVISISTKVNDLTLKDALIYTWLIPHCDDWGLITNDSRQLKALVVPMRDDISKEDIENFIITTEMNELIKSYSDCIEIVGFFEHQTITESKRAKTRFIKGNPQESPRIPKNIQPKLTKEKLTKEKLTKEKILVKSETLQDNDSITKIIDAFKEVNPSYKNLFRNKTERDSASRIAKEQGLDNVLRWITILPVCNRDKYFSTITTPYQLERNLGKLLSYVESKISEEKSSTILNLDNI